MSNPKFSDFYKASSEEIGTIIDFLIETSVLEESRAPRDLTAMQALVTEVNLALCRDLVSDPFSRLVAIINTIRRVSATASVNRPVETLPPPMPWGRVPGAPINQVGHVYGQVDETHMLLLGKLLQHDKDTWSYAEIIGMLPIDMQMHKGQGAITSLLQQGMLQQKEQLFVLNSLLRTKVEPTYNPISPLGLALQDEMHMQLNHLQHSHHLCSKSVSRLLKAFAEEAPRIYMELVNECGNEVPISKIHDAIEKYLETLLIDNSEEPASIEADREAIYQACTESIKTLDAHARNVNIRHVFDYIVLSTIPVNSSHLAHVFKCHPTTIMGKVRILEESGLILSTGAIDLNMQGINWKIRDVTNPSAMFLHDIGLAILQVLAGHRLSVDEFADICTTMERQYPGDGKFPKDTSLFTYIEKYLPGFIMKEDDTIVSC